MSWKTTKSKTILKNRFLKVLRKKYENSEGKKIDEYYVVEKPDSAVVAVFTKKMEIVMLKQYRHAVKNSNFEIPAGYIEENEKIEEGAKREVLEESGYEIKKLIKTGEAYAQAGFLTNKVHFFIAFNAKKIQDQKLDNSEDIEVFTLPWEEALKYLKEDKIMDMGSKCGVLLAKQYLDDRT